MNEKETIDKIEKIRREISNIRSCETTTDLFAVACNVTYFFQDIDISERSDLFSYVDEIRSFYVEIIWETLTSEVFKAKITRVLRYTREEHSRLSEEQFNKRSILYQNGANEAGHAELSKIHAEERLELNKTIDKNVLEEKQYIQLSLRIAFLPISFSGSCLSEHNLQYVRSQLYYVLREITEGNSGEFDYSNIIQTLNVINLVRAYQKNADFPKYERDFAVELFFQQLNYSRDLVGITLLSVYETIALAKTFRINSRKLKLGKQSVHQAVKSLEKDLNFVKAQNGKYIEDYERRFSNNGIKRFHSLIGYSTYRNIFYICGTVTELFTILDNESGSISGAAKATLQEVNGFFTENFIVFHHQTEFDGDWSNKAFIITIKLLSVLDNTSESLNKKWSSGVLINEINTWFAEMNQILNKHALEDDWGLVSNFLREENTTVEWKSTLYTPTQEQFINDKAEKEMGRKILDSVVKPILAMMNTKGGTVIVGAIEKPEMVVREYITKNSIIKNGITLFDISNELEKKGKDLDSAKREIQDRLFTWTEHSADRFNDLITVTPCSIKGGKDHEAVTILKIDIQKSKKFIYKVKNVGGNRMYTLFKRADGRTIELDVFDYLVTDNNS